MIHRLSGRESEAAVQVSVLTIDTPELPGYKGGGAERQETDLAKAQRIVGEELNCRGWTEQEVSSCAKGHPDKVAIARRLREGIHYEPKMGRSEAPHGKLDLRFKPAAETSCPACTTGLV